MSETRLNTKEKQERRKLIENLILLNFRIEKQNEKIKNIYF